MNIKVKGALSDFVFKKNLANQEGDPAPATFPAHHPILSSALWKVSITLFVIESNN